MKAKIQIIILSVLALILLGCNPKPNIVKEVENEDSKLLDLLLKPSDIDWKMSQQQIVLIQQDQRENKINERASIIIDGSDYDRIRLYIEHTLLCYPNINSLAQLDDFTFKGAVVSDIGKVGLEAISSCNINPMANSSVAKCDFVVRYPNLVSRVITRTESEDFSSVKELGERLISIIDDRISRGLRNSYCSWQ